MKQLWINTHKKCLEIKITKPSTRTRGLYNIVGVKRCTSCGIYTNDSICPDIRCPCCHKLFKISNRWKNQSNYYGGTTKPSSIEVAKKIKANKKLTRSQI